MSGRIQRSKAGDAAAPIGDDEAAAFFTPWAESGGALIAVSGGPDSIALLGLAAIWSKIHAHVPLCAATFDHGLRSGSAKEALEVKAFARSLGVAHKTLRWAGEKPSTRIQERARAARHAALRDLAKREKLPLIALAHHRDDQAETMLMRIAAGSGLDGLGGMNAMRQADGVTLHRPFLDLPKARLVATCRARGWSFIEDPSNADDRFARARWRTLAPRLAAEGLTPERLARLAARARSAEEALAAVTADWLARHAPDVRTAPAAAWSAAPAEIRLRVLAGLIEGVASGQAEAPPERLERLEALAADLDAAIAAGRPLKRNLRGVLVALDRSGRLTFAPEPPRRRSS